jgi:hypothetical protein
MAVVRYFWMFRTAAVVYLLFGAAAIWRYGLTDYDPAHRFEGIGCGLLGMMIGAFLFRRARLAVVLSAISAGMVAIAAVIAVPILHGPVILAFAMIALLFGGYAVLAARAAMEGTQQR